MKGRLALVVMAGLIGIVAGLIGQFPAARAVALADLAGVELAGVQGTVWQGRAERIDAEGIPPVSARWAISPWRLVRGRLDGQIEFAVAGGRGQSAFSLTHDGQAELHGLEFQGPAAGVARYLPVPLLLVEGEITARVEQAALRDGRPQTVAARLRWADAALTQPLAVELGAVTLTLAPEEGGWHRFAVDARDGALRIEGGGSVERDGRYGIDVAIEPSADAPAELIDILAAVAIRDGARYIIRDSGQLSF